MQDYRGIQGEFSHPTYQFSAGPWGHIGVVVERMEGKIIIIFLLLYYWFWFLLHLLTIVLHVCSVCLLLIHAMRLPSIGRGGPGPGYAFTIYFLTLARIARAPIGSRMRSFRHWGPIRTRSHLRQSRWRLGRVENQPTVALCTLEALLPLRARGWEWLISSFTHLVILFSY